MIGELDSKPFVVTLGETMIANAAGALTTTVSGDIEGFSGWDELEQFARAPEGAVRR